MAFSIEFSRGARDQLHCLTARQRSMILDVIEAQLLWEPLKSSRARKLLRTNPFSSCELRVGDLRVFYNVSADGIVLVVAIGQKKGNVLFVDGREYQL